MIAFMIMVSCDKTPREIEEERLAYAKGQHFHMCVALAQDVFEKYHKWIEAAKRAKEWCDR